MEANVLIAKGTKASLQRAYKELSWHVGVRQLTIYPFGRRYRMMIAGFVTPEYVSGIVKDQTIKIEYK